MSAAIEVDAIVKTFGDTRALDGVTFNVDAGEVLGLLGPNGAGKTTTLSTIAGLLALDDGQITLDGRAIDGPSPDAIGWVPQDIALYPTLTARENLRAFGELHGVGRREIADRVAWALDWIGLAQRADDPVGHFSGGMKRRVNIAAAVLHRPRLLLLDEPTVGVDPQARERIFGMLTTLRDDGTTLLHSSHELDDVEVVCDRLIVLDRGRVLADGATAELVRRFGAGASRLVLDGHLPTAVPGLEPTGDGRWAASVEDPLTEVPALLDAVRRAGGTIDDLSLRRPGLRDAFLDWTGKDLRE
ncbi:MAG: ABC transporter ATP-binding protein [Acidobacteriota bacterium]